MQRAIPKATSASGSGLSVIRPKKPHKHRGAAFRAHDVPAAVLVEACERFLQSKGRNLRQIAKDMQPVFPGMKREHVYLLLRESVERKYLRVVPPLDLKRQQQLAEALRGRSQVKLPEINVVNAVGDKVIDHLARETADLVLLKMKEFEGKKIHIGFGAGRTVRLVARELALLLQHEREVPNMVLHALGTGFAAEDPSTSAASFFGFFHDLETPQRTIDYRLVIAPPFVAWDQYASFIRRRKDIQRAMKESSKINIVITTLNNAMHRHGLLYSFMQLAGKEAFRKLRRAGWVGDVLWRPYSATAPITDDIGIRPITMFELSDLVELAKQPDRHVYLVSGPCPNPKCHTMKIEALLPILTQPQLRICNHLLIDTETSHAVLDTLRESDQPEPTAKRGVPAQRPGSQPQRRHN